MVWSTYCAFHKKAISNFEKGIKSVQVDELDLAYTKFKFEESLNDEHYIELRKDYDKK